MLQNGRASLTILSHCMLGPHADDFYRPPTEAGLESARKRREFLGNPAYDMIVAAPSVGPLETARVIGGRNNVVKEEVLYRAASCKEEMLGLFAVLGNAPLSAFFATSGGRLLRFHGEVAWQRLLALFDEVVYPTKSIAVVGYAASINAMGLAAWGENTEAGEKLLRTSFGPCQGFRMEIGRNGPENFEFIQ